MTLQYELVRHADGKPPVVVARFVVKDEAELMARQLNNQFAPKVRYKVQEASQ